MKSMIAVLCSFFCAFSASAAGLKSLPLNPELKKLDESCRSSVVAFSDFYSACIRIDKYELPEGMSADELRAKIVELGWAGAPRATNDGKAAVEVMNGRLKAYTSWRAFDEFVGNTGPYEIEGELASLKKQFGDYRRATQSTLSFLRRMVSAAGNQSFLDEDTYWAQSVNASAVWVVNPQKRTVYKFMIGDLDG